MIKLDWRKERAATRLPEGTVLILQVEIMQQNIVRKIKKRNEMSTSSANRTKYQTQVVVGVIINDMQLRHENAVAVAKLYGIFR